VETASEEDCNFLVMGRAQTGSLLERLVASIVERVLAAAPCRVGVLYGTLARDGVKGIALPVTDGANPRLAAELAPAFARHFGIPVRALTVVPPEAASADAEKAISRARETASAAGPELGLDVFYSGDAAQALVAAIHPDELTLIGAPRTDPVAALIGNTVPGILVAENDAPTLVVRDVGERDGGAFQRFFMGKR
jgi:nucleotide-binding universal stress UspA family protein